MNRFQFISGLMGLTGGSLLVPKLVSFFTRQKTFTLYEGWIAGYTYYDGPHIENTLTTGLPLILQREPQNEYDKQAIEIYAGNGKLGYISQTDNSVLARLMDQNAAVEAEIVKITPGSPLWKRVKVRIKTSEIF